jgi:hypothetical protein
VHTPCAFGIPFVQPHRPLGSTDSPTRHVGAVAAGHEEVPDGRSWLLPRHPHPGAPDVPPAKLNELPGGHTCDVGHCCPRFT